MEGVDPAGRLRVRVAAPPAGGATNAALVALLADELGLPKSAVWIARGATARTKLVAVESTPEQIRARWPGVRVAVVDAPSGRGG